MNDAHLALITLKQQCNKCNSTRHLFSGKDRTTFMTYLLGRFSAATTIVETILFYLENEEMVVMISILLTKIQNLIYLSQRTQMILVC